MPKGILSKKVENSCPQVETKIEEILKPTSEFNPNMNQSEHNLEETVLKVCDYIQAEKLDDSKVISGRLSA